MILKLKNISFETNLHLDEIIKIAEEYIEKQNEEYEINKETILYDTNAIKPYVVNGPVWYIEIICLKIKDQ